MSIYIILYVMMIIASFLANKLKQTSIIHGEYKIRLNKFFFTLTAFFFMFIIQGMRDIYVGVDTKAYIDIFDEIVASEGLIDFQESSFLNLEIGYVLLNTAISSVSNDNHFFILVSSGIVLFLHVLFLFRNSKNIYISIYLFFGLNHFITSMVSLRQYIAIGIIMWMLPSLEKKKIFRSALIGFVAFMFHNSTVVFILAIIIAYFFKKKIKYSWYALAVLLLSLPATIILKDFIVAFIPKYEFYEAYMGQAGIGPFAIMCAMLYFCVFMVYSYYVKDNESEYKNILLMLMAFAVYTPFLGIYLPWAFRLTYYFTYIPLLIVPDLIEIRWRKNKMIPRVIVAFISLVLFTYQLLTNAGNVVPYQFYN